MSQLMDSMEIMMHLLQPNGYTLPLAEHPHAFGE